MIRENLETTRIVKYESRVVRLNPGINFNEVLNFLVGKEELFFLFNTDILF